MSLIWECDGCGGETICDPLGHSDTGGKVKVCGPHCQNPECLNYGQEMDYVGTDEEQANG